jgi:t-SNARE complex subunit (syntaxin)
VAITAKNNTMTPEYQRIYEHNMDAIYQLTAQVLNARSERQSRHVRGKLADVREDLETLIAQGQNTAGARSD